MMTMVISGSDGVTFPDSTNQFSGGAFSFKNRIINGDCRIAQRGTGAFTVSGSYAVDRFFTGNTSDASFSVQQDSSAPVGFINSIKFTTTTADGTLTTTQRAFVNQNIEGFNVADLGWGTANAKTVTLSFWVRSSLTGTFGGSLVNATSNRSYPFTYTISVADTWEQKSVTIAGDTSGTWATDNGIGVRLFFGLGVGPDRSGTAGAWVGSDLQSVTGAVSVIGTLNATWYITGVQLEVGSVATPFERRPYGTELMLCQRYYYRITNTTNAITLAGFTSSTTAAALFNQFPVSMRVAPSALEQTGTAADYRVVGGGASTTVCSVVPAFSSATVDFARTTFTVASGLTIYNGCVGNPASATTAYLGWSAEL
jgi:hypothetical protein